MVLLSEGSVVAKVILFAYFCPSLVLLCLVVFVEVRYWLVMLYCFVLSFMFLWLLICFVYCRLMARVKKTARPMDSSEVIESASDVAVSVGGHYRSNSIAN